MNSRNQFFAVFFPFLSGKTSGSIFFQLRISSSIQITLILTTYYQFFFFRFSKVANAATAAASSCNIAKSATPFTTTSRGTVHKWHHPLRGGVRISQKVTLLQKAYLVKWVIRGREGSKISKNGWHHLWTTP